MMTKNILAELNDSGIKFKLVIIQLESHRYPELYSIIKEINQFKYINKLINKEIIEKPVNIDKNVNLEVEKIIKRTENAEKGTIVEKDQTIEEWEQYYSDEEENLEEIFPICYVKRIRLKSHNGVRKRKQRRI